MSNERRLTRLNKGSLRNLERGGNDGLKLDIVVQAVGQGGQHLHNIHCSLTNTVIINTILKRRYVRNLPD